MGIFFYAELCDLIGQYALSKFESVCDPKRIGLYRDDGLAIIQPKHSQIIKKKTNKSIQRLLRHWL